MPPNVYSVNMQSATASGQRGSYHHGDLRNALVGAAARLAEEGGPDAVTVRAAARAVGVTPTATYRHFANQAELLEAASQRAFEELFADMAEYLAEVPEDGDPVERAVRRFEASGRGYIRFAIEQPGLFRTAFCPNTSHESSRELGENAPYALLTEILDDLVAVGHLDPAHREGAESGAWAAVHGLSLLLLDGPLKFLEPGERERVIDATVRMVSRGLAGGPNALG